MPKGKSLRAYIDQYLDEQVELRRLDFGSVATRYSVLAGSKQDILPLGYCSFLEATGVTRPRISDLSSGHIGSFWEYLANYHGLIVANCAMQHLRDFWKWAQANSLLPDIPEPPDLTASKLRPQNVIVARLARNSS